MQNGDAETGYTSLRCEGLQNGTYKLEYLDGPKIRYVSITVHKGEQWQGSDGFILKKNCLQENVQSNEVVRISKVEVIEDVAEERKDDNQQTHQVKVWLDNYSKGVHVHAFATQFNAGDPEVLGDIIKGQIRQSYSYSRFGFAHWQNFYQNNRQLSDEIRYVFDRKQLESQLGNTLDRPTLLMKRNFTRKTQMDDERLNTGDAFAENLELQQNIMPSEEMHMAGRVRRRGSGGGGGGGGYDG